MYTLTHSCLKISLTSVVWTFDDFKNNLGITHKFTKYLKEGCVLDFDQHFSLKYFLKFVFVKEILLKSSDNFGNYRHERVKFG